MGCCCSAVRSGAAGKRTDGNDRESPKIPGCKANRSDEMESVNEQDTVKEDEENPAGSEEIVWENSALRQSSLTRQRRFFLPLKA